MWNHRKMKSLGMALVIGTFTLAGAGSRAADPVIIQDAEAYFDTDPGAGNGEVLVISDGSGDSVLQLATDNLNAPGTAGPHVLGIRFQDDLGRWSAPLRIGFAIYGNTSPSSNNVKAMETFTDTDPGEGSGQLFSGITDTSLVEYSPVINLDISGLSAGGHVLSVRAQDSQDRWSDPLKMAFPIYEVPVFSENTITAMEGFIGVPPPVPGSGSGFPGIFDSVVKQASGYLSIFYIPPGVYPYGARVQDSDGEWSGFVTMVFDFNDTDGDGLPDEYEDMNGLDSNDPTDADGDLDGDKFTNLDEYIFNSDPDNFLDTPTPDPSCSSGPADITLINDFTPGWYLCIGNSSIRTFSTINILDKAYLYLRAPVVELKPGARVETGATVRARTMDLIP